MSPDGTTPVRRLIVSEFITIDGVVEAPGGEPGHPHTGWVFPFHGPALEAWKLEELRDAGALLLGRKMYEQFAEAWPPRDGELADAMNGATKHVVSTTLSGPLAWSGAELVDGIAGAGLVAGIGALKADVDRDGGRPLLVHGSTTLAAGLLDAGLVDELRLMVFPVLVGGGQRLYPGSWTLSTFRLASTEAVLPDVVVLTYERRPPTDGSTSPGDAR